MLIQLLLFVWLLLTTLVMFFFGLMLIFKGELFYGVVCFVTGASVATLAIDAYINFRTDMIIKKE